MERVRAHQIVGYMSSIFGYVELYTFNATGSLLLYDTRLFLTYASSLIHV